MLLYDDFNELETEQSVSLNTLAASMKSVLPQAMRTLLSQTSEQLSIGNDANWMLALSRAAVLCFSSIAGISSRQIYVRKSSAVMMNNRTPRLVLLPTSSVRRIRHSNWRIGDVNAFRFVCQRSTTHGMEAIPIE